MSPSANVISYDKIALNANKVLDLPGFEGAGTIIHDVSKYHNNGTLNLPTWSQLGSGLWCLNFDGTDDYVNCGNDESLRSVAELSVEFWINIATYAAGQYMIAGRGVGIWEIGITGTDWSSKIDVRVGGAAAYSNNTFAGGYDKWTHVAFTFNDATNTLIQYMDASAVYTNAAYAGVLPASANDLEIGQRIGGSYKTKGYIALVRVYNRVLSAFEIQSHYNHEGSLFGL